MYNLAFFENLGSWRREVEYRNQNPLYFYHATLHTPFILWLRLRIYVHAELLNVTYILTLVAISKILVLLRISDYCGFHVVFVQNLTQVVALQYKSMELILKYKIIQAVIYYNLSINTKFLVIIYYNYKYIHHRYII